MSDLLKYFREYDINSNDKNYSFLQEGGDYVMYKGGNVQMKVSVDKKKRITTHLEDLNREIKINKKNQVMLLYDVLYEQFHVEDMDFDDEELNEENDEEKGEEVNNSGNKYNRNSILQRQQELSEQLKVLEKQRDLVYKEIQNNDRQKSIKRREILNEINLHTENIKIAEDEEERTKSYKEVVQHYNKLFDLNDVGIMEIANNPKLKFKKNIVINNTNSINNNVDDDEIVARNNIGANNDIEPGSYNNDRNQSETGNQSESGIRLDDIQLLDEETELNISNNPVVNNKNNNKNNKNNNNNSSISSFASAKSTAYESDDESKEAEFDLE